MNRRGFLRGAGALLAAPAIVRASSLMALAPVRSRYAGLMAYDLTQPAKSLFPIDWKPWHVTEAEMMPDYILRRVCAHCEAAE